MRHKTGLLALFLALLFLLSACSPKGSEAPLPDGSVSPSPSPADGTLSPDASPDPSPAPGDGAPGDGPQAVSLSIGVTRELNTLDPARTQVNQQINVFSLLFEGLMRYEASDPEEPLSPVRIVPGQAEAYDRTVTDEGIVYTFTLRADACWSDGQPVTADHFVYAWQRLIDPANSSAAADLLSDVAGAPDILAGEAEANTLGVEAVDARTLKVTLTGEKSSFLEVCASPAAVPLRPDVVEPKLPPEEPADEHDHDHEEEPDGDTPADGQGEEGPVPAPTPVADPWDTDPAYWVGNGPYVLSAWVKYSDMALTPNPHYYGGQTGPDAIHFLYQYESALTSAFQTGTVDFVPDLDPGAVQGDSALAGSLSTVPYAGLYYLSFNTNLAPFDDPLVREAFSLAIDRQLIADLMGGVPAEGLVPFGVGTSSGTEFRAADNRFFSAVDYEADCQRARAFLAQAGYPDGKGFPLSRYVYNKNDLHQSVAKALTKMWRDVLGVNITITGESWIDYLDNIQGGKYAIAKMSWVADRDDPAQFLTLWDEGNDKWYDGAALHDFLARAEALPPEERGELYHEAERLLQGDDCVLAPLYCYTRSCLVSDKVTGVGYSPLGWYWLGSVNMK